MDWELQHVGECADGESYCNDLSCWCHIDTDYHELVQYPEYAEGELLQAYSFYGIAR